MKIFTIPLGPVQANCYILVKDGHGLLIDPGAVSKEVDRILIENDVVLDAILLTHAHFDHIGGVDYFTNKYDVNVYLNPTEFNFFKDSYLNSSQFFMEPLYCYANPIALSSGKQNIGVFEIFCSYCPGHSIGSTVFKIDNCLFTGDVIFLGSIGRTDLPTGSYTDMLMSLKKIATMDDSLKIYPGHGSSTSIHQEKIWNDTLKYVLKL